MGKWDDPAYRREYHRLWRLKHHDRLKAKRQAAYTPLAGKGRPNMLRREYNLTPEDYYNISEIQDHKCRICSRGRSAKRPLYVDHDHATGRVRGLLCCLCNTRLGWLESHREGIEDYLVCPVA